MNEVIPRQENEFSFLSPNLIHQKYFHSGTFSLQVNILSGQMFLYICHVTNVFVYLSRDKLCWTCSNVSLCLTFTAGSQVLP